MPITKNPDGSLKLTPMSETPGAPMGYGMYTGTGPEMLPGFIKTLGGSSPGGAGQDRSNIDFLLNPNFNTYETDTRAAEKAVGAGQSGSNWAGNVRSNMLDSERIKRFQLGHEMLQPYLQRDFQASEGAADRASALQRAIMEGNQAMERLQLSEAGQTARLSQEERARLEQLAEQGRQSMQQLMIREAGESGRQRESIGGQLANTLLSSVLKPGGGSSGGGGVGNGHVFSEKWGVSRSPGYRWQTDLDGDVIGGVAPPPDYYNPNRMGGSSSSVGSTSVDRILRRYGLL